MQVKQGYKRVVPNHNEPATDEMGWDGWKAVR